MTPYERVKLSRQRTAGAFPLPCPLDCIRYAICELCEYDDALLRQERTADKRNSDRQPDPRAELGQALYMLLSAAVQWRCRPEVYSVSYPPRLHLYGSVLNWLTGFVFSPVSERIVPPLSASDRTAIGVTLSGTYAALCALAACHGWDAAVLVDEACAAFEAQHAPVLERPEMAQKRG